jgi:thioredoxin 1
LHESSGTESQRLRLIFSGSKAEDRSKDQPDIQQITDDSFVAEVLDVQDRLVVIDFWADHCVPCRSVHKAMQRLQAEMPAVKFCRVDVGQSPEIVRTFGLRAVPHIAVVLDGDVVMEAIGGRTYDELKKMIGSIAAGIDRGFGAA